MSLRELTDVLTALLFYDFLLSFMLTGCDGCIESDSKSLLRWRREAYRKTRVKVAEENKLFSSLQKNIIEFLGLIEQAQKFGLGSFDLKFYRLTKINGKGENYAILAQQQLELELPFLLGSDGEHELNGKKSVI